MKDHLLKQKNKPTSSDKSSPSINSSNSKISSSTQRGSSSNTKNKPTSSDKSPPSINSSNSKISSSTPNPKSNALAKLIEEGASEFVRIKKKTKMSILSLFYVMINLAQRKLRF